MQKANVDSKLKTRERIFHKPLGCQCKGVQQGSSDVFQSLKRLHEHMYKGNRSVSCTAPGMMGQCLGQKETEAAGPHRILNSS